MVHPFGSEHLSEGLKLVSFCPVCETRYNPMEARLLAEQGETHLLHIQCRKCRHSILALVLVNHVGASSVGLLTDLSYEDVFRVKEAQAVTLDDVIEVHRFLNLASWEQRLGHVFQEQVHHVRERTARRVKREQKDKTAQENRGA